MVTLSKKLCCIGIILLIALQPLTGISADGAEFVKNGGFEVQNSNGMPIEWSFNGGTFGNEFTISNEAKNGQSALHMKTEGSSYISQMARNLVGGTEYTLSFNAKIIELKGKGAGIKLEVYSDGGNIGAESTASARYHTDTNNGEWQRIEYKIALSQDVNRTTILIRLWGGGEMYVDDISFIGAGAGAVTPAAPPASATPTAPAAPAAPAAPYTGEVAEFFLNGDLETLDGAGKPLDWSFNGGTFGQEFNVSSDAKSGKVSLHMKSDSPCYTSQIVRNLIGGTEYTLSFNAKIISLKGKGAGSKLEVFSEGGNLGSESTASSRYHTDTNNGEWQRIEFKIPLSAEANRATVLIRLWGGGEMYVDDISFVGAGEGASIPKRTERTYEIKEPLAGKSDLITNGGLEKLDEDGIPTGWLSMSGAWGSSLSTVNDGGRGNVLRIAPASGNPWVNYTVKGGFKAGEEYQITAQLKCTSVKGSGPAFKVEFYGDSGEYFEYLGEYFGLTGDEWIKVTDQFLIPEKITQMKIYVRMYGAGEAYFDDIEVYQTEEAKRMLNFRTDVYCYTEWDTASASATFNSEAYGQVGAGDTVEFTITDNDTILDKKIIPVSEKISYKFKTSILKEKKKEYTLTAIYKDGVGNVLQTESEGVYRYDRPKHLTEDGLFIQHNGEILRPVVGYHVFMEHLDECAEAGINIVQSDHSRPDRATSRNIPYLLQYLDEAHKNEVMVLIVLYAGGNGGSDTMLPYTKAVAEAVKDHPAVFGYAIQDEPWMHFGQLDKVYAQLKAAYKAIRDIDDDHMVYVCDNRSRHFWQTLTTSDVMVHDPYPGGKAITNYVYDMMSLAKKEDLGKKKPVYAVNQAWPFREYTPTANDIRHQMYQSLFAGSDGIGYYDVSSFSGNGLHLFQRGDLYEGVLQVKELEYEDAHKAFVTGEHPTFCELLDRQKGSVLYKGFIKNNELYMIMINMEDAKSTVSIPLTSIDGSVKIGDFTATADDKSGAPGLSGSGTLNASLEPGQAVRYKITPAQTTDFSVLTTSKFRDLGDFGWAKAQVDTLANKGILNSVGIGLYGPGENITRADFAMFLVRTLGLTASTTETFDDVEPGSYYSNDIAIGKALGILNGIGDNRFDPYSEISRQDLMAICARGLRYVTKLGEDGSAADVAGFSDRGLIADYALSSVAAMVRED